MAPPAPKAKPKRKELVKIKTVTRRDGAGDILEVVEHEE